MWPFSKSKNNEKKESSKQSKYPLWEGQQNITNASKRDSFIAQNFEDMMHEDFPDNEDEKWSVQRIRHTTDYSVIEARPETARVGYESFIFLFHFDAADKGASLASYCLEGSKYSLLCTAQNCPTDFPREFTF